MKLYIKFISFSENCFNKVYWYSCKLSIRASKRHVTAGHQSQADTMLISSPGLNHSFTVFNYVQGSVGDITPKEYLVWMSLFPIADHPFIFLIKLIVNVVSSSSRVYFTVKQSLYCNHSFFSRILIIVKNYKRVEK